LPIADYSTRTMQAAQIAAERRIAALRKGESFAFETVMSSPEKVALITQAKALGYEVGLLFVTTKDPEINVQRVALRVLDGGHDVEPDRVRKRYNQSMDLLACAIEHADFAQVFDNSVASAVPVAIKESAAAIKVLPDAHGLPWVFHKLTQPYAMRLKSYDECARVAGDGQRVARAVAEHGRDYYGDILHSTRYHVLQDGADGRVLHDLQLVATPTVVVGQVQTMSYHYLYGKIEFDRTALLAKTASIHSPFKSR
jgi:predicted ABC-type ATPase